MAIHKLKIFAGSGSHELAAKIAESYGCELGDLSVSRFSDGEFQPAFEESIRGCTVFIVQSHSSARREPHGAPVDDRCGQEGVGV